MHRLWDLRPPSAGDMDEPMAGLAIQLQPHVDNLMHFQLSIVPTKVGCNAPMHFQAIALPTVSSCAMDQSKDPMGSIYSGVASFSGFRSHKSGASPDMTLLLAA